MYNASIVISHVHGCEILDSRGNPTVEVRVILSDGTIGCAKVPSGASTGKYEAVELRDTERERYNGKGVLNAVSHVNNEINELLAGIGPFNQYLIDEALISSDGTKDKSHFGANAILGTSVAVAKAAAKALRLPFYKYVGGISGNTMPIPMMNIINGGAHARNTLDIQEFMIVPIGAGTMREGLRWCAEVYQNLKEILASRKHITSVGDEGGFAPDFSSSEEALDTMREAIEKSGFGFGLDKEFAISIDAAASEWGFKENGKYILPKSCVEYTTEELIEYWVKIVRDYPVYSIEDPLDEEDWAGFSELTRRLGKQIKIVGDDLFVTNRERLSKGIELKAANSILIKPNQIGTLSETIETVKLAKKYGYTCIMSHRSGETEDTMIADLAVALNTGNIKTGAPCRSERVAKYNRLLWIEEGMVKL